MQIVRRVVLMSFFVVAVLCTVFFERIASVQVVETGQPSSAGRFLFGLNVPTITESTVSHRISLPATPSGALSGVVGDTADPGVVLGVDFTIADTDTPVGSLVVSATSSNFAVVPAGNLNLTGAAAARNLKITPAAVGYSTITVTVFDGTTNVTYTISYAASNPTDATASTRWHTGKADASTAVAVDANYMFVADDEDQALRLYDRNNSGTPVSSLDVTADLALTDFSAGLPREVDIEASARVGNRIYWLASHSNSSGGNNRVNRSRLFATDVSGVGAASTLTYVGRYHNLKADMIAWDNANGHGLGAGFLGLGASAAPPKAPEEPDGSGWNIEGLVFAPDNVTGYVSFRAPIVPAAARTKGLIVPVTNIAALVTGNPSVGPATFGAPILLNLGGRGIREIKKNAANEYLIVGGTAGGTANFAAFSWTGNPADPALVRATTLTGLNPECIVDVPVGLNTFGLAAVNVQLLSDNGDNVFYGDGVAAKDLPNTNHKKFRSDVVNVGLVPVAAAVGVSGRLTTGGGLGIARARVFLTPSAGGPAVEAVSTSFGYFTFEDVAVGRSYILSVSSKRFTFNPQIIEVGDEISGLEIVAVE